VKHLFIAMGTALVVSASMVAPAGATELDLNGRAFAGPDGTLCVGHNGTRQPLQLAAATDEQLANIPLVNDPAVVRLDSDPRVTRVGSLYSDAFPSGCPAIAEPRGGEDESKYCARQSG
jgi:hypothetical protein